MLAAMLASAVLTPVLVSTQTGQDAPVSARAKQLHERAIVIDSHDDTTQRLLSDKTFDIAKRQKNGNIDIPRMREGGLDALFFSIWVPSDVTGVKAVNTANALIASVHKAVAAHPNDLMIATTAAEVRRAAAEHKIAALMGMEGGHMINDDLGQLRKYAALGVRYLTLTHFKNNNWADSSTDKPAHNGLTPFGKDVVRELNRLGMMVDISHVADKTFSDVLELTRAPVITQNRPWNIANRINGYVAPPLLPASIRPRRPAYWVGSPRSPAPRSSPNAREKPTRVHTTMTTASAPKVIIIMLSTLVERTMPP